MYDSPLFTINGNTIKNYVSTQLTGPAPLRPDLTSVIQSLKDCLTHYFTLKSQQGGQGKFQIPAFVESMFLDITYDTIRAHFIELHDAAMVTP